MAATAAGVPSTLKMIRQRSLLLLPDQVYGLSIAVESQQQQQLPPSPLTISTTSTPSRHLLWKQRAENLLWLASAFFILYYGDFRTNLFTLLAHDPRVRRTPLRLGSACVVFDLGIFLYLAVRLRARNRIQGSLDVVAGAIPAATMVGLAAFILFCVALWPIWNILTVPMLLTLFMAFTVVAPYLSPYVSMKLLDADSLCYKMNS